jgi:hypothetical protein
MGDTYCHECYENVLLPFCKRCNQKIKGNDKDISGKDVYLTINGEHYHKKCFSCFSCGNEFQDLKGYLWNKTEFYCLEHYEQKVRSNADQNDKSNVDENVKSKAKPN